MRARDEERLGVPALHQAGALAEAELRRPELDDQLPHTTALTGSGVQRQQARICVSLGCRGGSFTVWPQHAQRAQVVVETPEQAMEALAYVLE